MVIEESVPGIDHRHASITIHWQPLNVIKLTSMILLSQSVLYDTEDSSQILPKLTSGFPSLDLVLNKRDQ
jgi:hypothetical protein